MGPFSSPFAEESFDTRSKAAKQVLMDTQVIYLADLLNFQWGSLGPLRMMGKTKFLLCLACDEVILLKIVFNLMVGSLWNVIVNAKYNKHLFHILGNNFVFFFFSSWYALVLVHGSDFILFSISFSTLSLVLCQFLFCKYTRYM